MPFLERDGLVFHYVNLGDGVPFFFQHGLGGDVSQPLGLFRPPSGFRLLALDCRGHGETRPLGDPERIGFVSFADDLLALMDHLGIARAIVGGISMGAAVALSFALRFSKRTLGLVLSRPAWLDGPNPRNVEVFSHMAELIRRHGARWAREHFTQSEHYLRMLEESPDCANSLLGQFENPRAEETVVKLERLPRDSPAPSLRDLERIRVPTLVMASRQDLIHPFEYGEVMAREIPGAEFRELTPKSVSAEGHAADVQRFVEEFLRNHFL